MQFFLLSIQLPQKQKSIQSLEFKKIIKHQIFNINLFSRQHGYLMVITVLGSIPG